MQKRWLVSIFGSFAIAVGVSQLPSSASPIPAVAEIGAASLTAIQTPTDPLPPACDPFDDLSSTRPVDNSCGLQGDPGASGGQHAQNRVKNNFCAHQDGEPAMITRVTFDRLQVNTPSKVTLPWGSRTAIPPSDAARNALRPPHDDEWRHRGRRIVRAVCRVHPRRTLRWR
jgi:hypothetical protein